MLAMMIIHNMAKLSNFNLVPKNRLSRLTKVGGGGGGGGFSLENNHFMEEEEEEMQEEDEEEE